MLSLLALFRSVKMTLEELFFNTSVFRVYVGPYSYGELNYCDRLHIRITFIYIITPLLTSTHKPVLARAPSSYPKYWKYALGTPIHNGGHKCNTTNYRPISILPIISKILERWVHSVVYSYLDECNLIPCCQSGFRPMHSTETTLHDLTNTCYQAMVRGKIAGTFFYRSHQSIWLR